MFTKYRFSDSSQQVMVKGGLRNLTDGTSGASIKGYFSGLMKSICTTATYSECINVLDDQLADNQEFYALLFSIDCYVDIGSTNNIDFLAIHHTPNTLFTVSGYEALKSTKRKKYNSYPTGVIFEEDTDELINELGYDICQQNSFHMVLFDAEGNLIDTRDIITKVPKSVFTHLPKTGTMTEGTETLELDKEVINQSFIQKQDIKIMTKLTNVVNVNKAALINAGKIEAGKIALKQVTKAIEKTGAVPFYIKGALDTPVGRVAIANLFSFVVNNYASNNKNAVLVADAMIQGAMVEMVGSFNIDKMLADVLAGIDLSALTTSEDNQ